MIARVWHGYTSPENASAYEGLLKSKIFPFISAKKVAGYREIQLLKRPLPAEIEFITIMWFDSLADIVAFAGEDYETAVVLPEAAALLKRYDRKSQHYEVAEVLKYPMEQERSIERAHLLTADLGSRQVTSVETNQITMGPGQKGELHVHPCPVVGYIVKGQAIMQIVGREEVILNSGDSFYEPADTPIAQFSNYSRAEELIFVAFYLLNGKQELIQFL